MPPSRISLKAPYTAVCTRLATAFPRRNYAIPRSTVQRINLNKPRQFARMRSGQYVFSKPLLALWGAACISFGATITYLGVNQGWLRFPDAVSISKTDGAPATENEEEKDALSRSKKSTKAGSTGSLTVEDVEKQIFECDAAKECLESPEEWKRIPYFLVTNEKMRESSLMTGSLHGPDKIAVEPLMFLNRDRKQFVVIAHIGNNLCGHEGIVHGGLQATLFDEITARPAFWNLPRNVALTASLKVNYRRPVVANQIIVFKTRIEDIVGRKGRITAELMDTKGNVLSDAESVYVSPSNEKLVPDRSHMVKSIESVYPGAF